MVNVNMRHLLLRYNQLTNLHSSMFVNFQHLTTCDLRGNSLMSLRMNTFNGLNSMTTLHLQNLNVHTISQCAFCGMQSVVGLNLSSNQISSLNSNSFLELDVHLTWLDISNNNLIYVEPKMFQEILFYAEILTTNRKICCIGFKNIPLCYNTKTKTQCPSMLPNIGLRSVFIFLSLLILLLNLLAMTFQFRFCHRHAHPLLIQMLSMCDALYGLYYAMLLLVDSTYKEQLVFHYMTWTQSDFCSVVEALLSMVFLLTRGITALISVNQLLVTKYALKLKPLSFTKSLALTLTWIILSMGFTLIDKLLLDNKLRHSHRCLPFSYETLYIFYIYFTFAGLLQVSTIACHAAVMQHLIQSTKQLGINRKVQHRKILRRMLILDVTNTLQWLIICCMVIAMDDWTLTDEAEVAVILCLSVTAVVHPICYTIVTSTTIDKLYALKVVR